ncbi:MAG: hypothetical protein AAGJ35_05365 [Myxococcota bacterium]
MSKLFPESLCHGCRGLRVIQTKRQTTYLMCTLRAQRYFPQPVLACAFFQPEAEGASEDTRTHVSGIEGNTGQFSCVEDAEWKGES